MSYKQTILVNAAGGHIGSELIALLRKEQVKLVLPTSNASRLQSLFFSDRPVNNVGIEQGSITDPQWFDSLLKKHAVDTFFLALAGTNELITTLNFLNSMKLASVKHLVHLSAAGDFADTFESFKWFAVPVCPSRSCSRWSLNVLAAAHQVSITAWIRVNAYLASWLANPTSCRGKTHGEESAVVSRIALVHSSLKHLATLVETFEDKTSRS